MEKDHSNISPSQAERFFNCPGSVQAQAKVDIIQPSSIFALEGTAIHEFAAQCLKEGVNPHDRKGDIIEVRDNYGDVVDFEVNDDFIFTVDVYRNKMLSLLKEHGVSPKALQIEAKFSIPEIDKNAKGTTDCSFVAGSTLYVWDLKAGRGVIIDPEENKQAMYYALRPFFDARMFIDRIVIGIIQPRAKEGDWIKDWETTPKRLDQFAEELKEAIKRTREKDPELKAGPWCKWCKVEGLCSARTKKVETQVRALAPDNTWRFPALSALTPEQIGNALPALEIVKSVLENLQGYALALASKGEDIPNYSLARKRKHRRWINEQSVIEKFGAEYGDDIFKPKTLRTPAQLEKVVKDKDELADYIEQPEGDLKLVPTEEAKEQISRKIEEVFKNVKLD